MVAKCLQNGYKSKLFSNGTKKVLVGEYTRSELEGLILLRYEEEARSDYEVGFNTDDEFFESRCF